jgi:hypothetical protein
MTTLTGYLFAIKPVFGIHQLDMSVLIITDTNGVAESASLVQVKLKKKGASRNERKIGEVPLANRYYKVDITTGNNYGPGDLKKQPTRSWTHGPKKTIR